MRNKIKAIEIGIFMMISIVFLNSVYNLFSGNEVFGLKGGKPLTASTPRTYYGLASVTPYETKCSPHGETFETSAAKVRILGPFCGEPVVQRQVASKPSEESAQAPERIAPSEFTIVNSTAHYSATVFSDLEAHQFSTDFIPLEPGQNKISLEFRYPNGKRQAMNLVITRK